MSLSFGVWDLVKWHIYFFRPNLSGVTTVLAAFGQSITDCKI